MELDKYKFVMRTSDSIDILRPGDAGGFTLITENRPTTLEMEWYKPGPLQPNCVVLKDLYIKIQSQIKEGESEVDINVSYF